MTRKNKIVTSQIETSDFNNSEAQTFSYNSNGAISYYDSNSQEHLFIEPGVLYGANYDSSEQSGLSTIKLIPDENTFGIQDQYLIVEPTAPNHIHIRAGGTQDESRATLILGGERNNVFVSDDQRNVSISTRVARVSQTYTNINEEGNSQFIANMPTPNGQEVFVGWKVFEGGIEYTVSAVAINTPSEGLVTITATGLNNFVTNQAYTFYFDEPYNHQWTFSDNGALYGPAMGALRVDGIYGLDNDPLYVNSPLSVTIDGQNGEYLNSISPENQIAKIAYTRVRSSDNGNNPITGALIHMGKLLYANQGESLSQYIIPTNDTVGFPIGTEIKFATSSAGAWGISVADDQTTDLFGENSMNTWTTSEFILPSSAIGTLLKVDSDSWILSSPRLTD